MDLRLDDPEVAGGEITGVRNAGGAGALFAAASAAGTRPVLTARGVAFRTATTRKGLIAFANPPQLSGTHILLPIYNGPLISGAATRRFILDGGAFPNGILIRDDSATTKRLSVRWGSSGSNVADSAQFTVPADVWPIFEMRFADARVRAWVNGAPVVDLAAAGLSSLSAINPGGHSGDAEAYYHEIGRAVSVITDPANGYSFSNLEPAVLTSRRDLAAMKQVTLA